LAVSDRDEPPPRQVITSPFDTLEELREWIDTSAAPASRDDRPVIAGQPPGPGQRASRDELIRLVEAHKAPQRRIQRPR
jgi:hypothetical protein